MSKNEIKTMPTMPEYSGENVQTKRIGGTTYIVT
jgi:hypothetical protein